MGCFFFNWSQLPSAALTNEKVFRCWWALAGKEPLTLCEPEYALEASLKQNIWRRQELISSLLRASSAKQTQSCPVPLIHIGLQIAAKEAFMLTFRNHPYKQKHRLFGFVPCVHRVSGLSAQERCPALAVASGYMLSTVCECKMFALGMSTYWAFEGRDAAPNLVLTKHLVPCAQSHSFIWYSAIKSWFYKTVCLAQNHRHWKQKKNILGHKVYFYTLPIVSRCSQLTLSSLIHTSLKSHLSSRSCQEIKIKGLFLSLPIPHNYTGHET